jgi:hypothetical protein
MDSWIARHRRRVGVALLAFAVVGALLAAGSVIAGRTFLDDADSVDRTLGATKGSISDALGLAQDALESGAVTVESLGGSLSGSADVVGRAVTLADRISTLSDALAQAMAAVDVLGVRPFAAVGDQFAGLAANSRDIAGSLGAVKASLSATNQQLPELAASLRRLGDSMSAIAASLGDLPLGPQLVDQLQLGAVFLFAVAGWFLVPSLVAAGVGLVLLRSRPGSDGPG